MLRIIAGEFKGRRLRTIDSPGTRPMTDRVRESLFSILDPELRGARFLDLFAGSGAVGIEALSRGAAGVVFVESDPQCAEVIDGNLEALGVSDRAVITRADAYTAVASLGRLGRRFGVVFAGPPYDMNHHNTILDSILKSKLCEDAGVIVLQYRQGDPLRPTPGMKVDARTYGITCLSFLRWADA